MPTCSVQCNPWIKSFCKALSFIEGSNCLAISYHCMQTSYQWFLQATFPIVWISDIFSMKSDSNTSPYKYISIKIKCDTFSDMSLEWFDSKNDIHRYLWFPNLALYIKECWIWLKIQIKQTYLKTPLGQLNHLISNLIQQWKLYRGKFEYAQSLSSMDIFVI